MSELLELNEREYREIEETLASNARGRAFLRQRDERAQAVATSELRRLLHELREALDTGLLHQELRDLRDYTTRAWREIAALMPSRAAVGSADPEVAEIQSIVATTERASAEMRNGADRLQALASRLPEESDLSEVAREISARLSEALTSRTFRDITDPRPLAAPEPLREVARPAVAQVEELASEPAASQPAAFEPVDFEDAAEVAEEERFAPAIEWAEESALDESLASEVVAETAAQEHFTEEEDGPSRDEIDALLAELDRDMAETEAAPLGGSTYGRASRHSEIDSLLFA